MSSMKTTHRSHLCAQVDETMIGQTVKLSGWVSSQRDHGGLVFIDLRDHSGLVQCVFSPQQSELFAAAQALRSESVLTCWGEVCPRPEGTEHVVVWLSTGCRHRPEKRSRCLGQG